MTTATTTTIELGGLFSVVVDVRQLAMASGDGSGRSR
jgi:hypothetical protein